MSRSTPEAFKLSHLDPKTVMIQHLDPKTGSKTKYLQMQVRMTPKAVELSPSIPKAVELSKFTPIAVELSRLASKAVRVSRLTLRLVFERAKSEAFLASQKLRS